MDILILSGFLGSGKTSLLLTLVEELSRSTDKKIAIIENEVGTVGVDNQVLQSEGLPVKELFSGCICCSLRGDLVTTMMAIEKTYEPDLVILEASGVAAPKMVAEAFMGYEGNIDRLLLTVLFDQPRFEKLRQASSYYVNACIDAADAIVLSKVDDSTEDQLNETMRIIRDTRETVDIIPVSAIHHINIDQVLAALKLCPSNQDQVPATHDDHDHHQHTAPKQSEKLEGGVACAESFSLSFSQKQLSQPLMDAVKNAMSALAVDLQEKGCSLIGHIKTIIKEERAGYCLFSLVDFDTSVNLRGGLKKELTAPQITINAIVYGLEKNDVQTSLVHFADTVRRLCPASE